jgi:tRNA-2-methylthio-N6-dimethylallyladenosine synthase
MNQHDAEKITNLLYHEGLRPASDLHEADLVLIHTCSVREKAEQKLYTELGTLNQLKRAKPDLLLGVSGCVAQQEGAFPASISCLAPRTCVTSRRC